MHQRLQELAATIQKHQKIHIVTHIDADGLTSGSIAYQACQRAKKEVTIEFIKQLDDYTIKRLESEQHELIWFTDLGSSISTTTPQLNKIITDHHEVPPESDLPFHFNPHLFGHDGSVELSGAGGAYLVAKTLDEQNTDLSQLAIVGAIGDLQDRRHGTLIGTNLEVLADAEKAGVITHKIDLRTFGRETRPLSRFLQYSNDPILPGLSGRESACSNFLDQLGIQRTLQDNKPRCWIDLSLDEQKIIINALIRLLLSKGFPYHIVLRLLGGVYELTKEQPGTTLHDAKEYATLLNSTARYGQYEVGLNICLGDREEWLSKGYQLLKGHRANLVEGLQFVKEEGITKLENLQYFHAKNGIRDTTVGIIANMVLNTEEADKTLPILGFAYTDDGRVKVSARTTQMNIESGIDLSKAMQQAASALEGVGGGHTIAAGATIPKGKEEHFIEHVSEILKKQIKI